MGNTYGTKQWKLDTSATISTDRIRIKKMEFLPSGAGDDVLVADSAGKDIWRVTDAVATGRPGLETIDFGDDGFDANGFVLTISAGCVLNVWLV